MPDTNTTTNEAPYQMPRIPVPTTIDVLRDMTANRERFQLDHRIDLPTSNARPEWAKAGRRAHQIATLTDLGRYVATAKTVGTIAFYTPLRVQVVLDQHADGEHDVVTCTLERAPQFLRWSQLILKSQERPVSQQALVRFLRANKDAFAAQHLADEIVGAYESLRGTLVHDADLYRDSKSRTSSFTVKRKIGASTKDVEVESVPMWFHLALPVLLDDVALADGDGERRLLNVTVEVEAVGGDGAEPCFILTTPGIDELVSDWIERALAAFRESVDFPCVRGSYCMAPRTQLGLPSWAKELLELHAKLLAAQAGGD